MQTMTLTAPTSKGSLWTGRTLTGLSALFLLMDGVMKLFKPAPVVEAMAKLGYPDSAAVGIGILLVVITIIYLIPRHSVFGAVLLTGYLGGAVSTNLRVGSGAFSLLFPVAIGLLVWCGIYLRDDRLRQIFPIREK